MKYEKDGLIIENTNPVCDSLFIKQGWIPVKDEPVIEVIDVFVSDEDIQQADIKDEIIDSGKQDEPVIEADTKSVEPEKKKSTSSSK